MINPNIFQTDATESDLKQFSYTNTAFDWYLTSSANATTQLRTISYRFQVIIFIQKSIIKLLVLLSPLNFSKDPTSYAYIEISQRPLIPLKFSLTQYFLLLCCDSSSTNSQKYANTVSTIELRTENGVDLGIGMDKFIFFVPHANTT